jgi:ELWxxDGT repeat protein
LAFESLEGRQLLAGLQLLDNVNATPFDSSPHELTTVGPKVYFTATTATGSTALWKSDGTPGGAVLVKDFLDTVHQPRSLTNVGGLLMFSNYEPDYGYELWRSDGTAAGTVRAKDVSAGPSGSNPQNFVAIGSTLYFQANDGVFGTELWKSTGSSAGTVRVKDINPNAAGSDPKYLTNVGGTLYFSALTATGGRELWRSNGASGNTTQVKDIVSGQAGSFPSSLTNVNGTLFFTAQTGSGRELWKSHGDAASTVLVKDILAGAGSSSPGDLTAVGGKLYFAATNWAGRELWVSSGTAASTMLVADLAPGNENSYPTELTNVAGTLYFSAADSGINKLWMTSGNGVAQIGDFFVNPTHLTNLGGTLIFTGLDPTGGTELWKSEGTTAKTVFVKDVFAGETGSYPDFFVQLGNKLVFAATDATHGRELWATDGSSAGTVFLSDIFPGSDGSHPDNLVNVSGTMFFTAANPDTGSELWKSDGTAAGTRLVRDIFPGTVGSVPTNLVNVNGTLFFSANDPYGGRELWKSNGTWNGTVIVKDLATDADANGLPNSSTPGQLTNLNGKLLFVAQTSVGNELWTSNGTAAGTTLVKDIFTGFDTSGYPNSSNPAELTNVNGTVYFRARNASGQELWKTDGTAAGTTLVRDINAGAASSFPSHFTNVNGTLLFAATNAAGVELWKSNGFSAGTYKLKDIVAGSGSSVPEYLTNVAGTLFFSAKNAAGDRELWKSNGTAAGTVLVKDIYSGTPSSYPSDLVNVGGTLFFGAATPSSGLELWRSDGTPGGTIQVKDIFVGTTGSYLSHLTNINGTLFFSARDASTGYELWQSDGTSGGTVRVSDVAPGTASSAPRNLAEANGSLFLASTGVEGEEMYLLAAAANKAPLLDTSANPTLGSELEDAADPVGALVQDLVNTAQSDPDAGALKGIAVVGLSMNGTWQYSLDGGNSWRNFGKASATDARLLPANSQTRIRLLPAKDYDGQATMYYRAWDRTQGLPGSLFDLTGHLGGRNAFSTALDSAKITVLPVNDAPVLKPVQGAKFTNILEDATDPAGTLVKTIIAGIVSDADLNAQRGIAIIGTQAADGNWQYSLNNGTTWINLGAVSGSSARLLAADDESRVRFVPNPDYNNLQGVKLNYRAWDQTAGVAGGTMGAISGGGTLSVSSGIGTIAQVVVPVNDAPVLDMPNPAQFTPIPAGNKNSSGDLVKNLIAGHVTDVDEGAVQGMAVTFANVLIGGQWQFTLDNGLHWQDMQVSGDSEAVLLKADDLTRIRFVPSSTFKGQYTIQFRAWDQTEGTAGTTFDCSNNLGGTHAFSTGVGSANLTVQ